MTSDALAAYAELLDRYRRSSLLGSCASVLSWDEQTHMPAAGIGHRARQLGLLAELEHDELAAPRVGELLDRVDGAFDPASAEAVNVGEIARRYWRARRLDRGLVAELAEATTLAERAWEEARDSGRYQRLEPDLARVIALKRREGAALAGGGDAYAALIAEHVPDLSLARIEELLDALTAGLLPLVSRLDGGGRAPLVQPAELPIERQRALTTELLPELGLRAGSFRVDESAHPFSVHVGPGDARLTTRFVPGQPLEGFFAALHETGHVLYDEGLPEADAGAPIGEAVSMAMHEGQARLYENWVGRSRGFWRYVTPRLERALEPRRSLDPEVVYRSMNQVSRSVYRIAADEVTYSLHIVIRFRLERALLSGTLEARDLPGAWREAYRAVLGVEPRNDAEGVLQDGHWAAGMFGYFPAYALGNLIAGQLFAAAEAALGDVDAAFSRGEFAPLRDWLRTHVHRHGRALTTDALLERATGSRLGVEAALRYWSRKYDRLASHEREG